VGRSFEPELVPSQYVAANQVQRLGPDGMMGDGPEGTAGELLAASNSAPF
jgi:hypothetical protein